MSVSKVCAHRVDFEGGEHGMRHGQALPADDAPHAHQAVLTPRHQPGAVCAPCNRVDLGVVGVIDGMLQPAALRAKQAHLPVAPARHNAAALLCSESQHVLT